MSRDTKDRVRDDQGMMSWEQFWAYFMSSYCTDDMRKFTMNSMNLIDFLDGAMPSVQMEIMEFAPEVLKKLPKIQSVLSPTVRSKLCGVKAALVHQLNREEIMKLYRGVK